MRINRWISPGVLLRTADLIGLRQESAIDSAASSHIREPRCTLSTVRVARRVWPYAVYSPPDCAEQDLPVILFLHGAGERGTDGRAQTKVGIGPALCAFPERYRAHVVMPQCPMGQQWSGPAGDAAIMALDETLRATRGSEHRVYLTGISMGARGALHLAVRSERFAGVVAICGWTDPQSVAARLKHLPIWVFHGTADPIVPVRHSRAIVRALELAGAKDIRYTEFEGVGHQSWDLAYASPEMTDWLFAQSRGSSGR